ncbi:hypothetical protein EDC16_101293 [Testudinibacter aquarius]|uniref:Uncharacterized protein n=1 Tax=Testudinibacter aquarius TaxID=1524974 RepID=A0A4R3YD93_9PAST|nr:hypothetical protein EDC16_101293 [Testudinibacter aquarius]
MKNRLIQNQVIKIYSQNREIASFYRFFLLI